MLKAACPYISQVVVHGDGRKYATALITLDPEAIEGWANGQGLSYTSVAELAGSREVHDLIEGHVREANQPSSAGRRSRSSRSCPPSSASRRARSPRA